jgi:2-amino-4-hydroxy-6-hydroxymethyldihydropteridine diphosphokinase
MNEAIVGVGSNIKPKENVTHSQEILETEQVLVDVSTFIWTKPVGFAAQPDFYNGAYLIATELDLDEFKAYLKDVERRLGRVRTEIKDGPRTMDLDLIMWNGQLMSPDFPELDYVRLPVDELRHRRKLRARGS